MGQGEHAQIVHLEGGRLREHLEVAGLVGAGSELLGAHLVQLGVDFVPHEVEVVAHALHAGVGSGDRDGLEGKAAALGVQAMHLLHENVVDEAYHGADAEACHP